MSENKNLVEIHGCIVCAKLFNVLAVYTLQGTLLDCTVTSPGGHIVPDESRPLVACNSHTKVGIHCTSDKQISDSLTVGT